MANKKTFDNQGVTKTRKKKSQNCTVIPKRNSKGKKHCECVRKESYSNVAQQKCSGQVINK